MLDILMVAAAALAQPAAQKPAAAPVVPLAEAVAIAAGDILSVPVQDQPATRYLWFPEPSRENLAAAAYALNTSLSHAAQIVRPRPVGQGRLLRIDLRSLCPRDTDFARLVKLWEVNLAGSDPYFHRPDVRIGLDGTPFRRVTVSPYRAANGKTYDYRSVPIIAAEQFSLHTDLKNMLLLHTATGSNLPVARGDWFVVRSLTTLDGGLYYDFRGLAGKNRDQALAAIGADPKIVANLRSDQRAGLFRSAVTAKPRQIEVLPILGVRPTVGPGLLWITHDPFDADVDPAFHAMKNLLVLKDRAQELIWTNPNGMLSFALFDAAGNLQDSAPDNVVRDHTIPPPHTARLQAAMSCIRCHGPHDGLQPFANDVLELIKPFEVAGKSVRIDVYDDEASRDNVFDTVDRLAGLYAGDLTPTLLQARTSHARAVYDILGGPLNPKSKSVVVDVCAAVRAMHDAYEFAIVTPETAAKELGHVGKDFNAVVPLLPPNQAGVHTDDPTILALRRKIPVTRRDWEHVYADAAVRAAANQLQVAP